jgi:hypothetical protein
MLGGRLQLASLAAVSLLVRALVGLHGYSGVLHATCYVQHSTKRNYNGCTRAFKS